MKGFCVINHAVSEKCRLPVFVNTPSVAHSQAASSCIARMVASASAELEAQEWYQPAVLIQVLALGQPFALRSDSFGNVPSARKACSALRVQIELPKWHQSTFLKAAASNFRPDTIFDFAAAMREMRTWHRMASQA